MKLHLNSFAESFAITGHGEGFVQVGATRVAGPLIVMPDRLISPWLVADPAELSVEDFAPLSSEDLELVVFGSGAAFRFPHPRIAASFGARRTGFEVMDTPAACRTFNVLLSEGRRVAAALLV
ncbi:MAG: Mth938-like domain-containing protein [Betaproteobacteria bacterium]|nr:Mth938-like domain-containing protein [Betaproteobacteria bacterium]